MDAFIQGAVFSEAPDNDLDRWINSSTDDNFVFRAGKNFIRLKRRISYPSTFAFVQGCVLFCGYGSAEQIATVLGTDPARIAEDVFRSQEFLYIAIDCRQGTVSIQRDAFSTVTLFVGTQHDRCVISDTFEGTSALLDKATCGLNTLCIAQYLLGQETYDLTFLQNIQLLYDRKYLQWTRGHTQLLLARDAQMKDYHKNRTGDPHMFTRMLESTIARYWKTYVEKDEEAACHLSCGLDSSTVAAYLATAHPGLTTITAHFPGEYGKTQSQKIRDFIRHFPINPVIRRAENRLDYPFMEVLRGSIVKPFYHYAEPYMTTVDELHQDLLDQGVRVVFTGAGGDELFEHADYGLIAQNYQPTGHEALLPYGLQPAADHLYAWDTDRARPRVPTPLTSYSVVSIPARTHRTYLKQGLWVVHPLGDPTLHAYMQTLPLHYCVDKILLRAYASAKGVPKSICLPEVNEDFEMVNKRMYVALREAISYALETSLLAQYGLIDAGKLRALHEYNITTEDTKEFSVLRRVLLAEASIRSLQPTI